MSEARSSDRKICPQCGAVTKLRAKDCWLCGAVVEENWETVGPGHIPMALPVSRSRIRKGNGAAGFPVPADIPTQFQFGLSTLMLIVTLVAIICSISIMAPGLGVVVAILVMGGFIGVIKRSATAAAEGVRLSREQRIGAFFRSVGITFMVLAIIAVVIAIVIFVALFIMCSGFNAGHP